MYSINHKIGVNKDIATAVKAINTIEGLSCWWTEQVNGSCELNEIIEFRFNGSGPDMKVVKNENDFVEWECIVGPQEWIGTIISFQLTKTDDEVEILFSHSKWSEISNFHRHCSMKWAVFLLSLKQYIESGQGMAFPNDIHIDHAKF